MFENYSFYSMGQDILRRFYFMTLNKPSNTNLIIFPTKTEKKKREVKNWIVFRYWVVFVAVDIMLKLPCIEEKALFEYRIKY